MAEKNTPEKLVEMVQKQVATAESFVQRAKRTLAYLEDHPEAAEMFCNLFDVSQTFAD